MGADVPDANSRTSTKRFLPVSIKEKLLATHGVRNGIRRKPGGDGRMMGEYLTNTLKTLL